MGSDSTDFPPSTPAGTWKPLQTDNIEEIASTWFDLDVAAARADGSELPKSTDQYFSRMAADREWEANSIGAFTSQGQLIARGWAASQKHLKNEYRIFLDGLVHPDFRRLGLGGMLLNWLTARGTKLLDALPDNRGKTLRHDFYIRPQEAIDLLESRGFSYSFAEDEMNRSLRDPILTSAPAPDLEFINWDSELAGEFYAVYYAAFRPRPGFPNWSQVVWVDAFTSDPEFRPDHTLLLRKADQGLGYAMVDIEDGSSEGWVSQMGVAPECRRRGYGELILGEVMRRLNAAGFNSIGLDVNLNNPEARGLYLKMGFRVVRRYTSYRKVLRPIDADYPPVV